MYFPYLFGRSAELLSLRAHAGPFKDREKIQRIWPVIEPITVKTAALAGTLTELTSRGDGAYVVMNPNKGDFKNGASTIPLLTGIATHLPNALIRPTFLQTPLTSLRDLSDFVLAHSGRRIGLIITSHDLSPAAAARALVGTDHLVFLQPGVSREPYEEAFGRNRTVDIEDNFIPEERNSDYSGDTSLGTNHLSWSGVGKGGFSDYTILPGTFKPGGGPMGAVALHLTYVEPLELRVQHFVSDIDTVGSMSPKYAEAITKIERQITTTPTRFLSSPGLVEFRTQLASGKFTSPEHSKRQQIGHHIYTVGKTLGL